MMIDLFEELTELIKYCEIKYNIPVPIIVKRGRGCCSWAGSGPKQGTYVIRLCPRTVSSSNIYYAYADTLHEVAHIIAYRTSSDKNFNHGPHFRETEIKLFKDFDLAPINYKRAYWNNIKTVAAGKTVY